MTNLTNRTYGIEIEFFGVTREVVAQKCQELGVDARVENYNHTNRTWWKIVTDSSVTSTGCNNSYNHGNEIVSPILEGEDGLEQLRKVCEALEAVGAKVDKTCGIHVHHGIGDLNLEQIKNIYRVYNKYENVIENMMPKSRRKTANNRYCKPLAEYIERIEGASTIEDLRWVLHDRYRTVNFQSYVKYSTIEFRQHSGSTDFEKISSWVLLTQMMVEKSKESKRAIKKIKSEQERNEIKRICQRFFKELGVEGELRRYILDRIKKLA